MAVEIIGGVDVGGELSEDCRLCSLRSASCCCGCDDWREMWLGVDKVDSGGSLLRPFGDRGEAVRLCTVRSSGVSRMPLPVRS